MYDVIVQLVGEVPEPFTFIYSILTLVFAMLVISLLFSIFYLPFNLIRR